MGARIYFEDELFLKLGPRIDDLKLIKVRGVDVCLDFRHIGSPAFVKSVPVDLLKVRVLLNLLYGESFTGMVHQSQHEHFSRR